MNSVLIDSDILIEVSRARDKTLLASWEDMGRSDTAVFCSPVTIAEIWQGARPAEHPILTGLFTALTCVPVDEEIGRRAGDYLRSFRKSHSVELGDALIAATATIHQLELWTRNRKHYPMEEIRFY